MRLAGLIWIMLGTTLAGIALTVIVTVPELAEQATMLIPAAAIAARQLASRGATPKAAKIIERTWKLAQHPELALVYAFARPGDSPRDRLDRIRRLSRSTPQSVEGPIALATAAELVAVLAKRGR